MKNIKKLQNLIIAHRGIHDNKSIAENSLPAFQKALQNNIPIELDIQLTKDKQLIVFHDNNLLRMTGENKYIKNLTLEEIKQLYLLNTKEKIPTLEEVLTLVNNKVLLDIELKNTTKIKELVNITLAKLKQYHGDLIIKSFNPEIIRYMRKKNPTYTYGILLSAYYPNKLYKLLSKSKILLKYYKPDFLAISKNLINNKNIKNYYKTNPILIWTITSKEELDKYKHTNYSYICNNLPYK